MTAAAVMKQLEAMGTAQNRKIYGRHGVGTEMFGVGYADLTKLKKAIKTDHDLARALWESGNHDARVLATMIADPEELKSAEIDAWTKELDNYVIADAFAGMVGRTKFRRRKMEKWIASKKEWVGRCGWLLLAGIAMNDEDPPDGYFRGYLETAVRTIHGSRNRIRDAMNSAVIAIGMRNAKLEKEAVAAAKRIGKVEVDHGQTGCKTPDAVEYIKKTNARKRGR